MSAWFWDVLAGLIGPPLSSAGWGLILRQRVPSGAFFAGWCTASGGLVVVSLLTWQWGMAACAGISTAVAAGAWYWWRRRRDRAPKLSGAKGRALLATLVRRAREAAQPRPVLRPAPGGAR